MKIYLAAAMPRITEANKLGLLLEKQGHSLTSYWHKEVDRKVENADYHNGSRAQRDKDCVEACDVFISLVGDRHQSRGGRHCELGLALAWEKQIILIGDDDDCIFTWLENSGITKIYSIEKFIAERLGDLNSIGERKPKSDEDIIFDILQAAAKKAAETGERKDLHRYLELRKIQNKISMHVELVKIKNLKKEGG